MADSAVEWPRAILCGFDPEFLRVPHEALISTMETNQKFFPVLNDEHRMNLNPEKADQLVVELRA